MQKKTAIPELIFAQNYDRQPHFLQIKYEAMASDYYRFFRATTELFFRDLSQQNSLTFESPNVWVCGDLHLENFGSYKGETRQPHFAINDFDEAYLAPAHLDPLRLITSLFVSAQGLQLSESEIGQMAAYFLTIYFNTLSTGYIRSIEKATATGIMQEFLEEIGNRKRKKFLDKKTIRTKGSRSLLIDDIHIAALGNDEKAVIKEQIKRNFQNHPNKKFFKVLDLGQRIAGTSSLGLRRYVALVQGNGSPDSNYLLDIKETRPSCLQNHVKTPQPQWPTEAHRIIEVQQRVLDDPPALLSSLEMSGRNYVIKELQPSADRINYALFYKKTGKMKQLLYYMATITAWGVLRSQGRQGSAIADDCIYWAKSGSKIGAPMIKYAQNYSIQMLKYHQTFSKAYKDGFFNAQVGK